MNNEEENRNLNDPQAYENKLPEKASLSIPVIEEKIKIDKKVVETGKVRISKRVHEEEETVEVPESKEEVDVERVLINQYVDTPPPAVRHEGDTMIIPVLKEVTVVEKRLLLVEEVRVTKRKIKSASSHTVNLRKEEVIVTRDRNKERNQDEV